PDRLAVDVLAHAALDPKRRELLGVPASVALTGFALEILGEGLGDLAEPFGGVVEDPADQEHVVILGAAQPAHGVAQVELHPPAANVQVRVALVFLPVEDVAAGRPNAAGDHAVIAKAVLDEIAIIRPVIGGPEDHLLAAPGPVGDLVTAVGLRAHPA